VFQNDEHFILKHMIDCCGAGGGGLFHGNTMVSFLGDGIFNSDGDTWRHQRKTVSLEFGSRILREFSTMTIRDFSLKFADLLGQASVAEQPVEMQVRSFYYGFTTSNWYSIRISGCLIILGKVLHSFKIIWRMF